MNSSGSDRDNLPIDPALSADKPTQAKGPSKEGERRLHSLEQNASDSSAEDVTKRKRVEERTRFQARLLYAVGQAVIIADAQGKIVYWNRAAEKLYGWSINEVIGRSIVEVTLSAELVEQAEEIISALRAGSDWSGEFEVRRKDGTTFPAMVTNTPVHDEEGALVSIVGVSTDITELKKTEELSRSEELFRSLAQNSHDVIVVVDAQGIILYQSPSVRRVLGDDPEEKIGKSALESGRVHRADLEKIRQAFAYVKANPGVARTIEFRIRHADGSWRYIESVGINLLDDPSVSGVIINCRDVTKRKQAEERLEHQAFHDPLTDLPNRRLFIDRLEQGLVRIRRQRGRKVAVLFMDLDGFRVANDSLGHEAGDRLLVAVSERLRGCLRPEDTLARFGGNEFTVLIEDLKEPADAARVAERIVEVLKEPFILDGRELFASAHIGIAIAGEAHTMASEELLRHADAAMYWAKEDSFVNYEIFNPNMYEQVLGRLELENSLRRALENEELRVYYQPTFRLEQPNKIAEIEALVRWEHPQKGLMLPDEFIAIAEDTGLILPLGRWILGEACRQAKEWQEHYPSEPPLAVCVNVSAKQVRYPGLIRDVRSALLESELEPGSLVLEMTESTLLKDTQVSDDVLGELKALGVRLVIDDFGREYSSLSYLKRLPVDGLKLDRSFVEDLGEDQKNITIVGTVISLAHSLGLKVTGEGVETAEQLRHLREMGCDLVQGHYLAKPLPSEEVAPMLGAPLPFLKRLSD